MHGFTDKNHFVAPKYAERVASAAKLLRNLDASRHVAMLSADLLAPRLTPPSRFVRFRLVRR
jgi:hypothetical protein